MYCLDVSLRLIFLVVYVAYICYKAYGDVYHRRKVGNDLVGGRKGPWFWCSYLKPQCFIVYLRNMYHVRELHSIQCEIVERP